METLQTKFLEAFSSLTECTQEPSDDLLAYLISDLEN